MSCHGNRSKRFTAVVGAGSVADRPVLFGDTEVSIPLDALDVA